MHNNSYENEFNLYVNEISFSYERMSTKTRFEKEAKGNSAYSEEAFTALFMKAPTVISLSVKYNQQKITLIDVYWFTSGTIRM